MTLTTALSRHVILPAYETVLKRRKIFRHWSELRRSEWLTRDELIGLQLQRLRRLLGHASTTCPYYAATWKERGLSAADVASLKDFERWPLLTREVVHAHRETLRTTAPGLGLIPKTTGGSSGTPLKFYLDAGSYDRRNAAWHRGYSWAGAGPGTRQLYLWGAASETHRQRRKMDLYQRLYRRTVVNTFEFGPDRCDEFVATLGRVRPDAIVAYTNPIYSVARAILERGVRPYSPRSVVVGAERLHAFQRAAIERAFGCPVFETYGCREFMLIGAECERHEGLHLTVDHLIVEILDDQGRPTPDGEEGNVVITDLFNYGMPFVRYVNGDRAVAGWTACSCGRGLPLLRKVAGRQLDVVTAHDGRQIPGEYFVHLLKDFLSIRQFQVYQPRPGAIELRLVTRDEFDAQAARTIRTHVEQIFGQQTALTISLVDAIPLTASGKLRVVVSAQHDQHVH